VAKAKKFYETDEFIKTKGAWYDKLAETEFLYKEEFLARNENGVESIVKKEPVKEKFVDTETNELEYVVRPQEFYVDSKWALKDNYQDLMQRILNEYPFRPTFQGEVQRAVIAHHAEGLSVRDIGVHIESEFNKKLKKSRVDEIIKNVTEAYLVQIGVTGANTEGLLHKRKALDNQEEKESQNGRRVILRRSNGR
jgi:hypothetical protein